MSAARLQDLQQCNRVLQTYLFLDATALMAGVPQKTLTWLYDVLKREYHDPNRTYSDLAHVLGRNPSFAPRTDVYTFDTGAPALLVSFKGTIPVSFRGNTYRFPISLWVPHAYPREGPMCYVTPTDDMIIRPGQYISGDGRIYHPYLAHWREHWERSNILDFLSILSDIFTKEPPVMSRAAQAQQRSTQPMPPPVPPLPRETQPAPPAQHTGSPTPPPPPPKHYTQGGSQSSSVSGAVSRPGRYDAPPPLPQPQGSQPSYGNGEVQRPLSGMNYTPQRSSSLRHSMPPHLPGEQRQLGYDPQNYGPRQPRQEQVPQYSQAHPNQQHPSMMNPPQFHQEQAQHYNQYPAGPPNQSHQPQTAMPQRPPDRPVSQSYPPAQQPYQHQQPHAPPAPKPPSQPNLLDSPFDLPLPAPASSTSHPQNTPAPPIPINPEKEALLTHLSHQITASLHQQLSQNSSALQPLSSQHQALQQTMTALTSELSTLKTLHATLSSNISVLQSSLAKADTSITSAQSRAKRNEIPAVDDMLTAPTVVARQLYDAACEERGIEGAMLALQEGFVRGRVSGEIWARRTRELAREGFKRRWMVRKIGKGMGLDLEAGRYAQ